MILNNQSDNDKQKHKNKYDRQVTFDAHALLSIHLPHSLSKNKNQQISFLIKFNFHTLLKVIH